MPRPVATQPWKKATESPDTECERAPESNDVEQGAGNFMRRKVSLPCREVWDRELRPTSRESGTRPNDVGCGRGLLGGRSAARLG